MARHMRGDSTPQQPSNQAPDRTAVHPQNQQTPPAPTQQVSAYGTPTQQVSAGAPTQQVPSPEAATRRVPQVPEIGQGQPEPASQTQVTPTTQPTGQGQGGQRFKIPEKKPHRKWPLVILLIVIICAGVLFVGRFVWPDFFDNVPIISDIFGGTQTEQPVVDENANPEGTEGTEGTQDQTQGSGQEAVVPEHPGSVTEQQTGSIQASDGATYNLTSDLHSVVQLESVSDDGVVVRFMSDPNAAYTTIHLTSCEINGEAQNAFGDDPTVTYTLHNEYTGDTTDTPDPYFIISPVEGAEDSTTLTIRKNGFTAADYNTLKLGIDQTFAYGELTTGEYEVADVTGLVVDITRA